MRDFSAYVRRHLSRGDVPEHRYNDLVEELASALEARYTALREHGAEEEDAWNSALAQVPSWRALAHDLTTASVGVREPKKSLRVRVLLAAERWRRELKLGLR